MIGLGLILIAVGVIWLVAIADASQPRLPSNSEYQLWLERGDDA